MRMRNYALGATLAMLFLFLGARAQHKTISRAQLEYYLARAIDIQGMQDLCMPPPTGGNPAAGSNYTPPCLGISLHVVNSATLTGTNVPGSGDDITQHDIMSGVMFQRYNAMLQLISNTKAKFITTAVTTWDQWDWQGYVNRCIATVSDIKCLDPEIVVQGAPNEYVTTGMLSTVGNIPNWVFDAFGQPFVSRTFNFNSMVWAGTNTPNIHTLEGKMWQYFVGRTYIDMGCESLSFSQVELMNCSSCAAGDPAKTNPTDWNDVFSKLRAYADSKPSIRFLLITGHTMGMKDANGNLAFDFHEAPIRPSEYAGSFNVNGGSCTIETDACPGEHEEIYGHSIGGTTPSGWSCVSTPALTWIDNYGNQGPSTSWGTAHSPLGNCDFPYHWDEITWFSLQSEAYRNAFLRYAYYKVHCLDPNVFFTFPIKRDISVPAPVFSPAGTWWGPTRYYANTASSILPAPATIGGTPGGLVDTRNLQLYPGYSQEKTIKDLIADAYTSASPNNWVHHDFTTTQVANYPATPEVSSDLIFVGNDRMYYIGIDGYIHGYIFQNGVWLTVSPSYAAQIYNGQNVSSQVKAASYLAASPDESMLLYIGVDGYIHGFNVNNVWNYTYFDFLKSDMQSQHITAKSSLIFGTNTRVYYIATQSDGSTHVHGFQKGSGYWQTVSPTYSAQNYYGQPDYTQEQASMGLIYDGATNRLYYAGIDGLFYFYNIYGDINYQYAVPAVNSNLISEGIRIASDLTLNHNVFWYVASDSWIHELRYLGGSSWGTGSASYSADMYNGQPISSQSPARRAKVAVSPDGMNIAYMGSATYPRTVFYFHDKDGAGWNYSYNTLHQLQYFAFSPNSSLQYTDNNNLYFTSYDKDVHYYSYQQSMCDNPAIYANEPSYVFYKMAHEDTTGNVNESANSYNIANANQYIELSVYPVPAINELTITLTQYNHHSQYFYSVSNIMGAKMEEGILSDQLTKKLNLSDYAPGIYLISIFDGQHKVAGVKRITIVHDK